MATSEEQLLVFSWYLFEVLGHEWVVFGAGWREQGLGWLTQHHMTCSSCSGGGTGGRRRVDSTAYGVQRGGGAVLTSDLTQSPPPDCTLPPGGVAGVGRVHRLGGSPRDKRPGASWHRGDCHGNGGGGFLDVVLVSETS